MRKIKSYLKKAKEKPLFLVYDILNTLLLIVLVLLIMATVSWIKNVMLGTTYVDPIAVQIGNWDIYWYGIILALAFIAAFYAFLQQVRKSKEDLDTISTLVFGCIILGIIGARIGFIAINWSHYISSPTSILNIWEGGLSFYGAMVTGIIFTIAYCAVKKINTWKSLDFFAAPLLISQAIGVWGSLFNQEVFGYPTSCFMKMYVSPYSRPFEFLNSAYFHPVFLYESILYFLGFIAIVIITKRVKPERGVLFLTYLAIYSVIRFAMDFVAIEQKVFADLTLVQIISLVCFVIVAIIMFIKKGKDSKINKSKNRRKK